MGQGADLETHTVLYFSLWKWGQALSLPLATLLWHCSHFPGCALLLESPRTLSLKTFQFFSVPAQESLGSRHNSKPTAAHAQKVTSIVSGDQYTSPRYSKIGWTSDLPTRSTNIPRMTWQFCCWQRQCRCTRHCSCGLWDILFFCGCTETARGRLDRGG